MAIATPPNALPPNTLPLNVRGFSRTLDQELAAVLRGASLECLVCGEFLWHAKPDVIACPECRSLLCAGVEVPQSALELFVQAG
jgi:hypothetical protein